MTDASIFATALEKADRAAYLADACRGDAELRNRVEGLLAAHDRAGEFLERPAVESLEPEMVTRSLGNGAPPGESATTRTQEPGHIESESDALGLLQPSTRPGSLGRIG